MSEHLNLDLFWKEYDMGYNPMRMNRPKPTPPPPPPRYANTIEPRDCKHCGAPAEIGFKCSYCGCHLTAQKVHNIDVGHMNSKEAENIIKWAVKDAITGKIYIKSMPFDEWKRGGTERTRQADREMGSGYILSDDDGPF